MSFILPNKMNDKFTSSITNFPDNGCRKKARVARVVLLEIFIIGLSKMQFPAFSGSELVNQDGILRH